MSAAGRLPTRAAGAPVPTVEGYLAVRGATEALAQPLSAEDQTVQTMADVSPTKWHRAHVTWFFERFVLLEHLRGYRPYDERYLYLFNSYYEGAGPRHPRPERGRLSRPGVGEVTAYRQTVDEAMVALLAGDPPRSVRAIVELGLHHEQQHQELLLMDIKHVLGTNPLRPAYLPSAQRGDRAQGAPLRSAGWIEHPGGLVWVGRDPDGGRFGFDNESPRHRRWLDPFAVSDRPVTCGDWLAFMADDGYRRPELWLSDGWAAVRAGEVDAPLYWTADPERPGDWEHYTLHGVVPVDLSAPVSHVSYYEADAFARWAGARLPTEEEWEAVAATGEPADRRSVSLHPASLRAEQPEAGWYGAVWQWTASAYLPYPGFVAAPGTVGEYNGKFMVGQQVLRGAAAVTPPGHSRPTYRNFFAPAARWPFSGLRLATSRR